MLPDVQISNVRLRLDPGQGGMPFEPLVESLTLDLSSDAFLKIVQQGIRMVGGRAPVDVELTSANLVEGGAEIVAKVKRSILKADLRARLAFSAPTGDAIRVRIAELDAPKWVPVDMVLGQAMTMAANRPGFSRVPGDDRAIDVDPAAVLLSRGIPAKLANPGAWSVSPTASVLSVDYRPRD
jgi:hypothetical protein